MVGEGDTPIVDFGAHFYTELPEAVRDKHLAIEEYDGAPICTDIDAVIDRYDSSGFDAVVLSQPVYMGSGDAELAAEKNDEFLEIVRSREELYGLAALPVAAGGRAAAEELERSLDAGYNGGAIETVSGGFDLVHEELEPVFEVADRTGAPLLVHPNLAFQEDGSAGAGAAGDRWELGSTFDTEAALAKSICKVVHEDVYDRYPNLRLVFHHNGGNIASMMGRIELWLNRSHRTGGEHLKTSEEFTRTVGEHVYVDTAGYFGTPGPFRATFERFPASNVLFASDFPYETLAPDTFRKIRNSIEVLRPDSEADAVLGGNALDLLVNV